MDYDGHQKQKDLVWLHLPVVFVGVGYARPKKILPKPIGLP